MKELRRTVALLRRDDEAGWRHRCRRRGISAHSSTRRRPEASPSNCTREGICRGSHRASEWRSTGSPRRPSRMRRSTRRSRGPFSDSRLPMGERRLVAETTGPTVAGSTGEPERPRYGLIGMRERATALGGEFAAGPTPGGWRVSCRLPLHAEDRDPAEELGKPDPCRPRRRPGHRQGRFGADPVPERRVRRGRRVRGRTAGGRGAGRPRGGCRAHGHPHAEARRHRRDTKRLRATRPTRPRAGADDLRRG